MNFLPLLTVCILIGYIIALPINSAPHVISDKTVSTEWYNQPLCVLKMGSSCPDSFIESQIKLSVQSNVNPRDYGEHGEELIRMGYAGASSLTRNAYDSLYTLTIATCCKN